jgi:hypothetical protein
MILFHLLIVEAVQKDLGLSADQMGKLMDDIQFAKERSREFAAKCPELSVSGVPVEMSEARSREFQASLKEMLSVQKELWAKTVGMLTPSQSDRLKQIQLQHTLATALTRPEIVEALDISEKQLAKIHALTDGMIEKQLAELNNRHNFGPKERRENLIKYAKEQDEAEAEANKHALDVLTPEQRVKLEKIVGKQIKLEWDYDALVPDDVLW